MGLLSGAETIVNQCLQISEDEEVLVLNDSNEQDLFDALFEVLEDEGIEYDFMKFEEPDSHGEEPPRQVAEAMKRYDVVIAPTTKSLSHTEARIEACEAGSRVATLPTIDKEVWNQSLQADYSRVKELSERVYELLEGVSEIRVETPSGTDISLEIDRQYFHKDTGIITEPGQFGNLPAGEADGGVLDANGALVIDHFPFAPSGTKVEVKDNKVVSVEGSGEDQSELSERLEELECGRQIAEFGFGTNPEATLIGNVLQDEKVFGTIHIAFGENSSYLPDDHPENNPCEIHWDTVCENPTVWFDDNKVLDEGEPTFT